MTISSPSTDDAIAAVTAEASSNNGNDDDINNNNNNADDRDPDDDDDDNGNDEKVFDLARRTGEIMDRYREYITEIGTTSSTSGGGGSGGDDATSALAPHNPFRYDIHADIIADDGDDIIAYDGSSDYSTKVIMAASSFLSSGGIRDFSIPEEDEDEERGATAGGLYSKHQQGAAGTSSSSSSLRRVSGSGSNHHYQYNLLKSRRFKKWILTFLLLVSVIAIAVGVSKSIKERNLPDWEKELAEEEEEVEKNKNQQGTTETAKTQSHGISPVLAHALDAEGNYINMAIRYKPVWFSRDVDDYEGSNYEAGVAFCATQDPSMFPCPYEAYCPEGEHNVPAGGYKGDNEQKDGGVLQWAPILDHPNGWVQVSPNDDNSCVKYETLNIEEPLPKWGESGTNVDQTKYIMCCPTEVFEDATGSENMVSVSASEGTEGGTAASSEEDSTAADATASTTAATTAVAVAEEDAAEIIMSDLLAHAINITQSESFDTDDKYLEMAYKYQPTWYSRSANGYLGTNFTDAVQFCSQQVPFMFPCPYEAYCPGGLHSVPAGGYKGAEEEVVQWAPFLDYVGAWVQVSSHGGNACMPYDLLNGQKPEWAENGVNEQQTRYLMCCISSAFDDASTQDSMLLDPLPSSSGTSANVTDAVTSSDGEILESEYGPDSEDHPQWYNRASGWNGTTYDEAEEFCVEEVSGINENGLPYTGTLCSYEDYCPNGARDPPYGGAAMATTVQWAPMLDFRNEWVQVGGEGDLCIPYSALNMEKPSWGQSGENTEGTQFILCCRKTKKLYEMALSGEEQQEEPPVTDMESTLPTELSDVLLQAINTTQSDEYDEFDANYIEMVYKYEPMWFSRDEGNYTGTTLLDAIEFCSGQNMMVPCPYEAYCPGGAHFVPAGGYKGDNHEVIQWAPIFGGQNAWVQISPNNGNECVTYDEENGMAPVWGENGANEEQTRYLMCCSMAAFETPSSSENTVDEVIADAVSSQTVPDSGEIVTTEYGQVDGDFPQWFNRETGWVGQTFTEAAEFCATNVIGTDLNGVTYGGMLCSYEAYCPEGSHGLPYGGATKASTVQWAPMSDFDNEWVQVGSEGEMCVTYTALNEERPNWGIMGGNEESTQFLMCCRKYTAGSAQQISDEQIPTSTLSTSPEIASTATDSIGNSGAVTLGQEIGTILEQIDAKYKIVAFGRNQGWAGSSYDEAATFCKWKVQSYEPCRYEAVCPNGVANFPSSDVSLWVPIDGVVYSYVELGVAGYCVGHTKLSGVEDATKYVLCCMQQ